MRSALGLENIARQLSNSISETIGRSGIMFRIFYRVKSEISIQKKTKAKGYSAKSDKLTDLIGFRLTLYFPDDVSIVQQKLMNEPGYDHISKDDLGTEDFKPVRCNLTFKFQNQFLREVEKILDKDRDKIAAKYEIQLRTVLSEGWHEVEHDLRYKCKSEWQEHHDLNRNMNGILATLETSEFSMLQIFDTLAHRHYKEKNLAAMVKSQFRIRLSDTELDTELINHFNNNPSLLKKIHRISRTNILNSLINSNLSLPLTLNHFIYIINYLYLNDKKIDEIAGEFVINEILSSKLRSVT